MSSRPTRGDADSTAFEEEQREALAREAARVVAASDLARLEILLEEGLDPDLMPDGWRPLLALAINRETSSLARTLVARGADVDARLTHEDGTIDRYPVLILAATDGHSETVRLLLDAGARIDACDGAGFSALMAASFNGRSTVVQMLVDGGADLELRDKAGYTALMFAANAGQLECVRILVEAGSEINARDNDGSIPIMFAAQHGYLEIVSLLLDHGADPLATGDHEASAVLLAKMHGHEAVIELIIEHFEARKRNSEEDDSGGSEGEEA